MNLGSAFVNMAVLEACLETGEAYIDTAIHEEPDKVCEDPPWYGNYEWKRRPARDGRHRHLGAGFDPGVVNAYGALAVKNYFDAIDTIDILDVNAGSHGRYFATNFDPEINFREFVKVWTWIDRQWVKSTRPMRSADVRLPRRRQAAGLPQRARRVALAVEAHRRPSIRFWMGFGDHYINVFTVLRTLGLLRTSRSLAGGGEACRSEWSRPCCPTPRAWHRDTPARRASATSSRAPRTAAAGVLIYQVSDHAEAYDEVGVAGDQLHRGRSAGGRRLLSPTAVGMRSRW